VLLSDESLKINASADARSDFTKGQEYLNPSPQAKAAAMSRRLEKQERAEDRDIDGERVVRFWAASQFALDFPKIGIVP
jgi:hypothetical protein